MTRCALCGRINTSNEYRCTCGGPLQLDFFKGSIKEDGNVWSVYRDFFPYKVSKEDSLGEGNTPLTRAKKLSAELDINLYLKNETVNPTWSFKDRGTIFGIKRAIELGYERIGTVSTGNMAASLACYGAYHGLQTFVLVPSDIHEDKIGQISMYGPEIIGIDGDYGSLYFESLDLDDIYFINSDNPYRIEGYKSIAFEIASEVEASHVIIPTSSGGLFRGIVKGYEELFQNHIISDLPKFIAVQAEGCSPIQRAFAEDGPIRRWKSPNTVAKAISNSFPPSGDVVVRKLKELKGTCAAVDDHDILEAQSSIARDGIYCQPASAVGVAALPQLMDDMDHYSKVVSLITGSGMKVEGRSTKVNTVTIGNLRKKCNPLKNHQHI
ncbi:MAG: threonine synthase [Thermoplasmata archaeon]